jgi:hypothetical protein
MDLLSADNLWDDQLSEMAVCKGNLINLRSLSLAKGKPKRNPWLGQATDNIVDIPVLSLLVPILPNIEAAGHWRVP